ESTLAEARLSAQAAARSEEAYETVMNMVTHDREVIANLEAQLDACNQRLEQLQAQIDLQSSRTPTVTREPVEASQDRPLPNTSNISSTARGKLPADPRLARMKTANMRRDPQAESIEETITPPLRVPRPYSSSSQQTPRPRLLTPRPPSPITPTPTPYT
ncbi:hypothetical protein C0993_008288, partial [Termitomyces sp. T159_Od127]